MLIGILRFTFTRLSLCKNYDEFNIYDRENEILFIMKLTKCQEQNYHYRTTNSPIIFLK